MKLYSVKDELSINYEAPELIENDEIAKRYFNQMCKNIPVMKNSPNDFSIWAIGEYNKKTGVINAYPVPELIERGHKNERREDQETV